MSRALIILDTPADRMRATTLETLQQAFERRIVRSDGCWGWRGATDKDGYAVFMHGRKQHRAHSLSLALDGRPVPRGMYACHHCDNPSCTRPDHLYVGTPTQNARDAKARGRLRAGRKAKVSPEDVVAIRAATGTHEAIARQYGISRAAVSLIRERKTWRDLP